MKRLPIPRRIICMSNAIHDDPGARREVDSDTSPSRWTGAEESSVYAVDARKKLHIRYVNVDMRDVSKIEIVLR